MILYTPCAACNNVQLFAFKNKDNVFPVALPWYDIVITQDEYDILVITQV